MSVDLEARWRALAETAAGGRFERLWNTTDDDITVEPLYQRRSDDRPRPWRPREAWSVSQRIDNPDASTANRSAILDLEGGADALTLVFAASPFARGFGLDAGNDALGVALADVELDMISVRLDAGGDTLTAATALADLVADRRLTSAGLEIDLGFDPIGTSAGTGATLCTDDLRAVIDIAHRGGLTGRPLLADGRPYHEAGAGEARELAAVVATGVAYIRHLGSTGLDLATARDGIAVLLAVDADLFLGLAKIRAVRRLWARIEAASGLDPKPLRVHAETSWRAMTRYDPWMNVLRASAGVTAAGLGGADAITVLPMTLPLGLPDDWTRRIARNTGRVLIDEANLAKVDDAAAGSGGLEGLTDRLCEKAWTFFQDIETRGGIEAALRAGSLQAQIAETARRRHIAFGTLERGIVGTSHYPSLVAGDIAVLDTPRRPAPSKPAGALPSVRDAEPFEALRDEAEARAAVGAHPAILLVALGKPAHFGARATYATNFFAAAGIIATPPTEATDIATMASRFADDAASVACLCGSDAAYVEQGVAAVDALRKSGAVEILMVGTDEIWRTKGINTLIHDGIDALQALGSTLEILLQKR